METRVKNLEFAPSNECIAIGFFTPEEPLTRNAFPSVAAFVREFKNARK